MGLKERRKKIMALMLAACVAGTSIVPVAAADINAFSDGESIEAPEMIDSTEVDTATNADEAQTQTLRGILYYCGTTKVGEQNNFVVDKNATTITNVTDLEIPKGYELTEGNEFVIRDGYVRVDVREAVTTKDITVVYQNRKGKIIDDKDVITVDKNAISVNTGDLTAPKGYTIAITGDITISKNNKVYITVDQNKKAVRIIFKESGKVIDSSKEISVVANAKFVKLSRITAPAGYQIVTTKSNLKISKKNTVTVKVKKLGKTIKVIYRDTTNEIVDTREIVVDKKTTSISSNKIPVPAGYEMLTTDSCSVRTGKIDVYVVKR